MKTFLEGMLIGSILAILLMNLFPFKKEDKAALKEVKVTQVSGDKIEHSGFNYTGNTIKFGTQSEGKGTIVTEIPKTNIPEARMWMQNNNGVMLELLYTDRRIYGASYMRRWGNFSAGGGVLISESKFEGIKAQAQYWFSL